MCPLRPLRCNNIQTVEDQRIDGGDVIDDVDYSGRKKTQKQKQKHTHLCSAEAQKVREAGAAHMIACLHATLFKHILKLYVFKSELQSERHLQDIYTTQAKTVSETGLFQSRTLI